MPMRGEREHGESSPMVPLMVGCAVLTALLAAVGLGGYFLIARRMVGYSSAAGRAVTPLPPAPIVAPPSLPEPAPDPARAPLIEPSADGTEIEGALLREVIARVVRRHLAQVQRCYEIELRADPALTARVVAHFTIDATGSVSAASADGSDDVALTTCIAAAVRTWTFPAPEGGGVVTVNYPFVLSAS